MIHVRHIRNRPKDADWRHVYCGRAQPLYSLKGSPLANQAKPGGTITFPDPKTGKWTKHHHATRDQCVVWYAWWLNRNKGAVGISDELNRLAYLASSGELYLYCWCAPKRCHCDVIKDVVTGMGAGE